MGIDAYKPSLNSNPFHTDEWARGNLKKLIETFNGNMRMISAVVGIPIKVGEYIATGDISAVTDIKMSDFKDASGDAVDISGCKMFMIEDNLNVTYTDGVITDVKENNHIIGVKAVDGDGNPTAICTSNDTATKFIIKVGCDNNGIALAEIMAGKFALSSGKLVISSAGTLEPKKNAAPLENAIGVPEIADFVVNYKYAPDGALELRKLPSEGSAGNPLKLTLYALF